MHQHFIIEGRYLGSAPRTFDLFAEAFPRSVLLYCDQCGEAWAKFPVEASDKSVRPWIAYRMTCRKHTTITHLDVPGSIWLSWDSDFLKALPLPVLEWEFNRQVDYFEKAQR
jgi:hypothetical protein